MRFLLKLLVAVFGINAGLAQTNTSSSAPNPTALEIFVQQPSVQIVWSTEVSQMKTTDARVGITALVAQSSTGKVRGIRLDLTSSEATDQVYLEEDRIPAVVKALEGISRNMERFRKQDTSSAPYRYFGSDAFRQPLPTVHTLSASYYWGPDSSGLSLSAFKGKEFKLPNEVPGTLSAALSKALQELQSH
jgi:hypothetical protein